MHGFESRTLKVNVLVRFLAAKCHYHIDEYPHATRVSVECSCKRKTLSFSSKPKENTGVEDSTQGVDRIKDSHPGELDQNLQAVAQ